MWSTAHVPAPRHGTHSTIPLFSLPYLSFYIVILRLFALAGAADISVDDNDSSISYSPSNSWQQGNGCSSCLLSPNSGEAHDGTWHDTTYYPDGSTRTISFSFSGVGISAYFIIPDKSQGTASVDTSLTFTLDDSQVASYSHTVSGSADFLYNHQVFSKTGLSNGQHTFIISGNADSGGGSTVMLFDYLVYTTEDQTSTSSTAAVATSSPSPSSSSSSGNSPSSPSTSPNTPSPSGTTAGSSVASSSGSTSVVFVSGSPITVSLTGTSVVSPAESSSNGTTVIPDTSSGSSSAHTNTNTGAIVGGVVGGLLGLLLLALLLFCWRRKRRQVSDASMNDFAQSPTMRTTTDGGDSHGSRSWFCPRGDYDDPMLAPRPVMFRKEPATPETDGSRFDRNSSSQNIAPAAPYNDKGRPRVERNAPPNTAPNGRESTTQNSESESANPSQLSTTAILSQVAAIQAAVLSLQEQRMQGQAGYEGTMAPPAYSRSQ